MLIPKRLRESDSKPREIRVSLRTRSLQQARLAALKFNLGLEQRLFDMNDIDSRHLTSTWTLKAGDFEVRVDGDEDAANFNKFLEDNPQVKAAFIRAIEKGADPGFTEKAFRAAMERFTGVPAGVHAPTPLRTAFSKYVASRSALADNKEATVLEKQKMLEMFADFLIRNKRDPGVIEVSSLRRPELIDFVQEYASRQGKERSISGKEKSRLSARTVQKLIGQLKDFFGYAVAQEWCSTNPIDEKFDESFKSITKNVAKSKAHESYSPFSDLDVTKIFEPRFYLQNNSAADYFWGPLLAAFTGARLGEIAQINLQSIEQEAVTDVYTMKLGSKNENSIRAVPVPEKLIELGFITYVEKVRSLGQTRLFPNRQQTATELKKPGKALGDSFAKHLNDVGVISPALVFHSFRHTVVTRMHVHHVPLGDAELIVGHAAQDAAVRLNVSSGQKAFRSNSAHYGTYTHPEAYAEEGRTFFERLKQHLDHSIHYPLDFEKLKLAADVVLEHVKIQKVKGDDQVVSGWHVNKEKYTAQMLQRLN
ncbi:site-specific integrase [bacterium]|nr:site-specific integrase [bacterium]